MPKLTTMFAATAVLAGVCIVGYISVGLAQEQSETPKQSYSNEIQQTFEGANSQAKSEFDKNYPKPVIPKTPQLQQSLQPNSGSDASKDKDKDNSGSEGGWQAPKSWQPPAQGWQPPGAQKSASSSSGATGNNNASGSQNIYAPGGSSNSGNQNQSAVNPYR